MGKLPLSGLVVLGKLKYCLIILINIIGGNEMPHFKVFEVWNNPLNFNTERRWYVSIFQMCYLSVSRRETSYNVPRATTLVLTSQKEGDTNYQSILVCSFCTVWRSKLWISTLYTLYEVPWKLGPCGGCTLSAQYADSVDLKCGLLNNMVCTVKFPVLESNFSCNITHTPNFHQQEWTWRFVNLILWVGTSAHKPCCLEVHPNF